MDIQEKRDFILCTDCLLVGISCCLPYQFYSTRNAWLVGSVLVLVYTDWPYHSEVPGTQYNSDPRYHRNQSFVPINIMSANNINSNPALSNGSSALYGDLWGKVCLLGGFLEFLPIVILRFKLLGFR